MHSNEVLSICRLHLTTIPYYPGENGMYPSLALHWVNECKLKDVLQLPRTKHLDLTMVLKECIVLNLIAGPLCQLFKIVLLPTCFRTKGRHRKIQSWRDDPSKYRPISQLSFCQQSYESRIHNQLKLPFVKQPSDKEFGFHSEDSSNACTVDLLTILKQPCG